MKSSTVKSALRLLSMCAALLLLAAAVTVAVAVVIWNSDAARQLRQCRERARNGTAGLDELEDEAEHLRRSLRESVAKEKELQGQLSQADHALQQLHDTLVSCRHHAAMLSENLTSLENGTAAMRSEFMETQVRNEELEADMKKWQIQVDETGRALEGAKLGYLNVTQRWQEAESQSMECRAQNTQLQDKVRNYATETEKLRQQLSARSTGRLWQCSWQLVGLMAASTHFLIEGLKS
ncbi:coiled-coil domain-containing protein 194-like [Ambystoma mexicanum]|uniref:coiled-coil domain-containing protein 194-like n=1 Tax=Ambystoma mexicanum TaxID=8296 RepID=UPI0037E78159